MLFVLKPIVMLMNSSYYNPYTTCDRNYIVEKFDTKKGEWERVSDSVLGTNCTVPSLQEGHPYKFRVMAKNANGVSEPLEWRSRWSPRTRTTRRVRLGARDRGSRPHAHRPQVAAARKRRRRGDHRLRARAQGGKRHAVDARHARAQHRITCVDDGVRDGKEYQYRVSAVNTAGQSEPSHRRPSVREASQRCAYKLKITSRQ